MRVVRCEVHAVAFAFDGGAAADAGVVDADLVAVAFGVRARHAVVDEAVAVVVEAIAALLGVRIGLTCAEPHPSAGLDASPVRRARALAITQAAPRAHLTLIRQRQAQVGVAFRGGLALA